MHLSGKIRRGRGIRLLVAFALFAQLWLPVLHAHGNVQMGMIPAELHGALCILDDGSRTGPDDISHAPGEHPMNACECLACKAPQVATLPALVSANGTLIIPADVPLADDSRIVRRAEVPVLPPPRAPPSS